MATTIDTGMEYVSQIGARLAAEYSLDLKSIEWPQIREDVERKVRTLVLSINSDSIAEKFTDENLEAVTEDKKIRTRIEARLINALKTYIATELSDHDIEIEDPSEEEEGPTLHYSISSYGADYPVDALVKRIQTGSILIPAFQRKFVWKKHQASRFIESLLLGLPVPGIFLAKEAESNQLLVIDGQQRLRTLQFFYQGSFEKEKTDFELINVSKKFEGLTYRTLLDEDRRRLDDSILHATVVKQERPEDDDSSIYLVFERLNSGASLLHPQEIRACIFHGEFNELLGKFNKYPSWRAIYGPENSRMKDQELILRFFALFFDLDRYSKPMEGALNRYMKSNRRLQLQSEEVLANAFFPAVDFVANTLGASAFRPVRAINAAVFDAVMVSLTKRMQKTTPIDPVLFAEAYSSLLRSPEFLAAYEHSTSSEEQVRKRIALATQEFERV
jgi:hypothetical protein